MLPTTTAGLEELRMLERRIENGELRLGDHAKTAREQTTIKREIVFDLRMLARSRLAEH